MTSAGASSYSFDANGNQNSSGFVIGPANEITSDGTWNYTYDAVGDTVQMTNIASGNYWTYGYNLNNQITSAAEYSSGGTLLQQAVYVYDVFGNMISQTVTSGGSSLTTKYSYDVSSASIGVNTTVNPVWAQLNASGSITERYLYDANGKLLARIGSGTTGTAWLLTDRQGSVEEVLNLNGIVEDSISYDVYGNITYQTNASWTGNFTFQGMRLDATTGLIMAGYRFVLPDEQWSGVDPLGFAAGDVNTRRDSGNDGANEEDPSGLEDARAKKNPILSNIIVNEQVGDLGQFTPRVPHKYFTDFISNPAGLNLPNQQYFKDIGIKKTTAADFQKSVASILEQLDSCPATITYSTYKQLNNDVLLRAWIVTFAIELHGNVQFPSSGALARGDKLLNWKEDDMIPFYLDANDPKSRQNAKGLLLKGNASPTAAIKEFFQPHAQNALPALDCASFIIVVYRRALYELYTKDKDGYNMQMKLPIAGLRCDNGISAPLLLTKVRLIGSQVAFEFPKDVAKDSPFHTENVIVIGKDLFIGQGIDGKNSEKELTEAIEDKASAKGTKIDLNTGYGSINPLKLPEK